MKPTVTKAVEARKWFEAGLKETVSFRAAWERARFHAINSGFCFLRARGLCNDAEWAALLEEHSQKIKPRTVRFWMQLSDAALNWSREQQPQLTGPKLQEFAVKEVMLMSPKPLIVLLRDLRLLRPFGEYDAVKYAQKKLGAGSNQIEFDFASILKPLDALLHFGEDNFQFVFPEGVDESAFISDVEQKLEAALARVREVKQNGRVIEA